MTILQQFPEKFIQQILTCTKQRANDLRTNPRARLTLADLEKLNPTFPPIPVEPETQIELPTIETIETINKYLFRYKKRRTRMPIITNMETPDFLELHFHLAELHRSPDREANPAYSYPMTATDMRLSIAIYTKLRKLLRDDYETIRDYLFNSGRSCTHNQ